MALDRQMLVRLRRYLNEVLDLSELQAVCYDTGIDFQNLAGSGKMDKIRELLSYIERREYLFPEFLAALHDNRPDLDLQLFGGPEPEERGSAVQPGKPVEPEGVSDGGPVSTESPKEIYENFDILVEHLNEDQYLVRASYTYPKLAAQSEKQRLDPGGSQIVELVSYLENLAAEKEDAKNFGRLLYDFLFPRSIHSLFTSFRDSLRREERGVRIRLQIKPRELNRFPWEYCFDEQKNVFLAKDSKTPVVRYIDQQYEPADLVASGPLRLLHVVSSPGNLQPLNVEGEAALLESSLQRLQGRLDIQLLKDPDPWMLQNALNEFKPHILHYTGHGEFKSGRGALLLVNQGDPARTARPLEAEQLADILRNKSVKIVVLNACETATAAVEAPAFMSVAYGLVLADVPAVIAMQYKMPDYLALRCTQALYTNLAGGEPLDKAVTEMRIAASLGANPEDQVLWGIPVLYMLPPDGRIWRGRPAASSSAPQTSRGGGSGGSRPASSGGVSFGSIGGDVTIGGDVVGGDKIVSGSTGGAPPPAAGPTAKQFAELEGVLQAFLPQLEQRDREDARQNLQEARASMAEAPPDGRRAARKLENIVEILTDAGVGELVIPLIKRLSDQARKG